MKKLTFFLICFLLFSCAGPSIIYRISTNTDPYKPVNVSTYDLKISNEDPKNLVIEKKILKMVDDEMKKKGWVRNTINPDYFVSISFSISDGKTTTRTGSVPVTTSRYNYQTNKTEYTTTQQHYSTNRTTYERKISVYLHSKDDLVWQGDLISHGSSQDVMFVAPHLIPEAIRYMGQEDISEKSSKSIPKK